MNEVSKKIMGSPDKSQGLTAIAADIANGETALVNSEIVTGTHVDKVGAFKGTTTSSTYRSIFSRTITTLQITTFNFTLVVGSIYYLKSRINSNVAGIGIAYTASVMNIGVYNKSSSDLGVHDYDYDFYESSL